MDNKELGRIASDRASRASHQARSGLDHSATIPCAVPASQLARLFDKTRGKAWEPPDPQHPVVLRLIAGGYVARCDMRCGFEAFKDSGLKWTEAGRAIAIEARSGETAQRGSTEGKSAGLQGIAQPQSPSPKKESDNG